jgi:hypothetical protein
MKIHPNDYDYNFPFTWTSSKAYGWDHRKYNSRYYYGGVDLKKVKYIIENNIGKSFDLTYKYFCKKYPNIERKHFLDEFEYNYRRYYCLYYVNDEGNIVKGDPRYKKTKKSIIFRSFDLQTKQIHKISLNPPSKHQNKWWYWQKDSIKNSYVEVVTQGVYKEFKSKKDKLFVRLMYEKNQAIRRNDKLRRINKSIEEESLLHNLETSYKKKQLELDIIKRDSHGFDENSFKGKVSYVRK